MRIGIVIALEMPMIHLALVTVMLSLAAPAAFAQSAALIERGKQVYADQKCRVCHAIAGEGNRNGALDEVGAKLSVEETRQWIVDAPAMAAKTKSTRKPLMRAYTNIQGEDLDALVAYMQSLKP
jgi:mono/diheme cytochrome c family protein